MAVLGGRGSVGGPASVCNAGMGVKDLRHVDARLVNELSELDHLAHLLEGKYLILLVSVDGQTSRVIASVL
jgi:hypothetical protein